MAMKTIPVSTAMAIWFGVALIGVKIVDTYYFKVPFAYSQLFFMLLIIIGVIGLKRTA
jgi:quaternary ammonium compound-resistance protein SugE